MKTKHQVRFTNTGQTQGVIIIHQTDDNLQDRDSLFTRIINNKL